MIKRQSINTMVFAAATLAAGSGWAQMPGGPHGPEGMSPEGMGPTHGYELLEALPSLTGEARVDMGNLYRVLRGLEEDGLVTSRWEAGEPGPAKRTYDLTDGGRRLLDEWAGALQGSRKRIDTFLDRYEGR